tara:strand:+ start:124 stop:918 length:795 start_codon:yes stop_codon:yes gene_type:complete
MAKAKDGSECYTRTNKSGGKYVTCEGTQKGGAKMSANKKVTLEQQKRSQKRKKDIQAAAKADKAIKEASDRIKKKKAQAKPKPKAKVPAIKVVKGTKKSIDLDPTETSPRKTKAKAKAGEVTVIAERRATGLRKDIIKTTTITYKVPKHSVNQTESLKILRSVIDKYDKGEYKFVDRSGGSVSLGDIKFAAKEFTPTKEQPVNPYSNAKPRLLDAKLTFKEGEKKGTISYKQFQPDPMSLEQLGSKTRSIGGKFSQRSKTIIRK